MAACMVIAGTFIESWTDSHLLAASWTYENPLFLLLLSLFFVNILFSALRRWPFKKKHIPFLITHLGLLMIIAGTMVKNRMGLQGQLTVWEGSGSSRLQFPHTHALWIEKRNNDSLQSDMIAFHSFQPEIYHPFLFSDLKCKLVGYSPHVEEKLETWIKGDHAFIAGFPSIPVHPWIPSSLLPKKNIHSFAYAKNHPLWEVIALRTPYLKEAVEQIYTQGLILQLKEKGKEKQTIEIPLKAALLQPLLFLGGKLATSFDLPSPLSETPSLEFLWKSEQDKKRKWSLSLQGKDALFVKSSPVSGIEPPFTVDLIRSTPTLLILENETKNTHFFAFDLHGRIHHEEFPSSGLKSLLAYEEGFKGYGVQAIVPIPSFSTSREEKEKGEEFALVLQLKDALKQNPSLAPPLHFFKQACNKSNVDFCSAFVQFLSEWNQQKGFLHKEASPTFQDIFKHFDWTTLLQEDQQTIQWSVHLLNRLEEDWSQGEDLINRLEQQRWPFVDSLKNLPQPASLLNGIARQIQSVAHHLPPLEFSSDLSDQEHGEFLSAYFRAYGIDYRSLFPYQGNEKEQFENLSFYWKEQGKNEETLSMTFETPLSHQIIPMTEDLPIRLEDRIPGIVLDIQKGQKKERIALAYDATGKGLKHPLLNGEYRVRFQPHSQDIPHHIRLRQARQISYPQSQQIYSYESDILISEKGKTAIEKTLSMNQVYETWDGYRFYLAGIGTSPDETIHRIQLAVNYDPAKFFLTYPGAFLVFVGSVLLFWGRRRY